MIYVVSGVAGLIVLIFFVFGIMAVTRANPEAEPEPGMAGLIRRLTGRAGPRVEKPVKIIHVDLTRQYDYLPVPA